ncbi:MAG: glycine oxidase ThiO [Solirubrobacterales bacterium]|nr:glycine oxidase ThiO [Solirubrobacterales bacterium]
MTSSHDLVVVGGGAIGLACAWRCAQAGMSVLVLEREAPGAGASGVAAGMLAPVTEASFGEEALLALNLEARAAWPGFAAELEEATALPTGYLDSGALVVAADRDDAEELRRLHAFQVELGLGAEWLTPSAAREREPALSPRIAGAIHAPQDGQADPRAVVRALAAGLVAAGGELRTGVEAVGLETAGGRVGGVQVVPAGAADGAEREVVPATSVLIAAGAWSSAGEIGSDPFAPPVRPVKGQLLDLRVRPGRRPPARHLIRTPRCYLLTRPDGQVVLGATQEEQGFDRTVTADGVYRLLEAAWEVLPDAGELELVGARAGLRPATPDNAPAVGAGDVEGLLWATGHHRNGIVLAPLTAAAIAARLSGREPPAAFAPFGPDRFAGGVAA